jgi:uncharacterized BrkB/YihY/UPF0761 family membrane protein
MRENAMNKREFLALFKVALIIGLIIFFTAVLSDFSVRMYYDSTNWFVQVVSGIIAIIMIAIFIMILFWWIPDARKAVLRVFGLDEEQQNKESK